MARNIVLLLAWVAYSTGCATENSTAWWQQGDPHRHWVIANQAYADGVGNMVVVYIGGDGQPWLDPRTVARDPTPERSVAQALMRLDTSAALFLGRACMYGSAGDIDCDPLLWTADRYSESVVSSMASALPELIGPWERVMLVGYSGGGVLATALAEQLAAVTHLVTIAANLDVGAWVAEHGYADLPGSIDPVRDLLPLRGDLQQLHLFGVLDANCPMRYASTVFQKDPNAAGIEVRNMAHRCCWTDIWPALSTGFADDRNLAANVRAVLETRDLLASVINAGEPAQ